MQKLKLNNNSFTSSLLRKTALFLFFLGASHCCISQSQTIGSFPFMDGGFENQAVVANIPNTIGSSYWSADGSGSSNIGSIIGSNARTGFNYLKCIISSSGKKIASPKSSSPAMTASTAYTLQFYYRTSSVTNSAASFQYGVTANNGSNIGYNPSSAPWLAMTGTNNSWVKYTITVTTPSNTPNSGYTLLRTQSSSPNINVEYDDWVVYQGGVDNTAPPPVTAIPTISVASQTSFLVSWSAPAVVSDVVGYLVVRGTTDPSTSPNTNGIYGKDNSVGANGTVVYVGTATSFTDDGLSNNQTYYYRIYAVDKAFNYSSSSTVVSQVAGGLPEITTTDASSVTNNTALSGGEVTAQGYDAIIQRGVCWSTSVLPTTASSKLIDGAPGVGAFTSSVTGLTQGTTYYLRAFATNSRGTTYGNQVSFKTLGPPTVTLNTISNITSNAATGDAEVTDDGGATILERGFCWSTSPNPTTSNSKQAISGTVGTFTGGISGLSGSTSYYVNAYARNAYGTSYSSVSIYFTTLGAYYNKPNSDVSIASNWGTNADGTGSSPANFSAANTVYNLYNLGAYLGASLTITGANSKMVLGNGTTGIVFSVPGAYSYSGTIDVTNNATLTIYNTTIPTLGTLSPGSTVNFDGAGVKAPTKSYYNIGLNNAANFATGSSTITVTGAFSPGNVTDSATVGSTVIFGSTSEPQYVPAFKYQTLTINNTSGIATTTFGTGGFVKVQRFLNVNQDFTIAATDWLTLLSNTPTDSCIWSVASGKKLSIAQYATLDQQTAVSPAIYYLSGGKYYADSTRIVVDGEHWMNSINMTTHYGGRKTDGSNDDANNSGSEDGMKGVYSSTSKISVLPGDNVPSVGIVVL